MVNDYFEKVPLETLVSIHDSERIPVKKSDRNPGEYAYYGASGITDYIDDYIFDGDYVLLSEDGDNLRTRNTPIAFMARGKFWVNNHAHILKGKDGNITDFICYALQVAQIDSYISGSTRPKITQRDMKNIPVSYAPIPIQNKIVHILGTLDDKIELNHQMNETLEAMAQALFKSWFVDFDPVIDNALLAGNAIPEPLKERAEMRQAQLDSGKANINSEINDLFSNEFEFTEELGWIPKGWKVNSIDDLIEINPKLTLKKGTVSSHADMKALPESGFNIDGVIKKEYSGGTKFQNRDILFARITPCLENGKTGLVDFLEPEEVGFGSTEFIVLREKGDIKMEFVACLARNKKFRLHAIQSMVGSSGRQRVQNSCFSDFFMALPQNDNKILKLFNDITSVNFNKISIQAKESQTLAKLRDTLLPKLMSGELRIPDAEKLVQEAL